jgi:hypothetical protein
VIPLGQADAEIVGAQEPETAGTSVAGAGDVNGDGFDDLILGAPRAGERGAGERPGAAYLFYGPVRGALSVLDADAVFLGEPDSWAGRAVAGLVGEDSDDSAGYALAGGYDIDGDAVPDIVAGAWGDDSSAHWAGAAYLYTGSVLGAHNLSEAEAKLIGLGPRQLAGISVASVGDFNGDGLGDLMVGSVAGAMPESAYLLYGPVRDSLSLAKAPVSFIAETESDYEHVVAGIGDLNGDGFADIAVGSPSHDGAARAAGAVYVFYGCR